MDKFKKFNRSFTLLAVVVVILIALYLFHDFNGDWTGYIFQIRLKKSLIYIVVGLATTLSSFAFQALTQNKLLTPGILGIEAFYILLQSLVAYLASVFSLTLNINPLANFILITSLMIGSFAFIGTRLREWLTKDLGVILLFGLVIGQAFNALATFIQVLLDPNEYDQLQTRLVASFQNVDDQVLLMATIVTLVIGLTLYRKNHQLDVMRLGNKMAINFGIDIDKEYPKILLMVIILSSVTTALIGPITFLGFVVVNITYYLFSGYWHRQWFVAGTLIALIFLFGGQLLIERVFNLQITLSMVIEFIGGILFIGALLWRRNDAT